MTTDMTTLAQKFQHKQPLAITYWEQNAHVWDAIKGQVEQQLQLIFPCQTKKVKTLSSEDFWPCDLIVTYGGTMTDVVTSLKAIERQLRSSGKVWPASLVIGSYPVEQTADLFQMILSSNWNFDVVDPDHLESLPTRVCNLIRIQEHLQELRHYDKQLQDLESEVAKLVTKLSPR